MSSDSSLNTEAEGDFEVEPIFGATIPGPVGQPQETICHVSATIQLSWGQQSFIIVS